MVGEPTSQSSYDANQENGLWDKNHQFLFKPYLSKVKKSNRERL
jgi:hypothetical protein